jgi:hypothetical protein
VRSEGVLVCAQHRAQLGARRTFEKRLGDKGNDLMTLIPPRGGVLRQEARDEKGGEDRWPGRNHRNVSADMSKHLGSLLELLEPLRQPISIGAILCPPRQLDRLPKDPLQPKFEKRTVMNFQKPVGDMDSEIRVNPDQVGIKGCMMDFRQRQAIRDDPLPELLVGISDNVGGIK